MSAVDDQVPEEGSDDLLAAEYVLGVLDAPARAEAASRIEADADFARRVDRWEQHFAPLSDGFAPVVAPPSVKAALDRRLFAAPTAAASAAPGGFWASLTVWRSIAFAALAALALAVAIPLATPPAPSPQAGRLVASLSAEGSDVRYLVVYDAERGGVGLSHLSGERASGRDFELWVIEGDAPPVSVGIIPPGQTAHIALGPDLRGRLARGGLLAVSMEPAGGSPTGQPTGPVVAAGDLRDI